MKDNKLYKKVYCTDRKPIESDFYYTDIGIEEWNGKKWSIENACPQLTPPESWLEEVEIPTDEEIESVHPMRDDITFNSYIRQQIKGAQWMRDKILNSK